MFLSPWHHLLDKGYCVYADNFYCSPEAALALIEKKTDLVGTVRVNRKGVPKDIVNKSWRKMHVQSTVGGKGKMGFMKWSDKLDVRLLSTKHELGCTEEPKTH